MKHSALVVGVSLLVAGGAGIAVAAPGGAGDPGPPASVAERVAAKKAALRARAAARPVTHVVRACVTADAVRAGSGDATTTTVATRVLAVNAHARRALGLRRGADFTAGIDGARVRLVGRARVQPDGPRLPRIGSWDHVDTGDVVTVRFRAPRNATAADFPQAALVIDHGQIRPRICPPAPSAPVPAS